MMGKEFVEDLVVVKAKDGKQAKCTAEELLCEIERKARRLVACCGP